MGRDRNPERFSMYRAKAPREAGSVAAGAEEKEEMIRRSERRWSRKPERRGGEGREKGPFQGSREPGRGRGEEEKEADPRRVKTPGGR